MTVLSGRSRWTDCARDSDELTCCVVGNVIDSEMTPTYSNETSLDILELTVYRKNPAVHMADTEASHQQVLYWYASCQPACCLHQTAIYPNTRGHRSSLTESKIKAILMKS
jgi:hypothetical protein